MFALKLIIFIPICLKMNLMNLWCLVGLQCYWMLIICLICKHFKCLFMERNLNLKYRISRSAVLQNLNFFVLSKSAAIIIACWILTIKSESFKKSIKFILHQLKSSIPANFLPKPQKTIKFA